MSASNTSKNTATQLTVLTSEFPEVLTKRIFLDKNGSVIKEPSAQLIKGKAEVATLSTLQEFSELLQGLSDNQALVYGVPKGALSQANVVTKKAFEKLDDTDDTITRSNDHFEWPAGPGVMMFDYDPDGEALDKDAVLQLLYEVCPEIEDTDHLWWTSSSSNIKNEETDEQLSGVTGQRVYIMVQDASDIPRTAEVIAQKLWLASKGFFKISKSGATLTRVPFDMAVYQPSRLDFAAGASTVEPLTQDRGQPKLIKGTHSVLDTVTALPDLSTQDLTYVEAFKHAKQSVAMLDAEKAKEQYIADMSVKLKENDNYLNDDDVEDILEHAVTEKLLPISWPLHVWTGDELVEVSVETVLNNKFEYHGLLCLDPIEPDYDGGRLVGKLYLDQESPCLHSFARGGHTFMLIDVVPQIYLPGCLSSATTQSIQILEHKGAAYSYGGSLAVPIHGKLVTLDRIRTKLLLSNLIQFVNKKGPIDPSSDLADGVLAEGADKKINPVKGFVDHPIIDANLRAFSRQGYDRSMQILGRFDHNKFDVLDRKLTEDEVLSHLARIFAPFTGFELAGIDDRSVLFAAIFSAVVRQVLPTCPAFGFDAPMQGSGKTYLADSIAIITSGAKVPAIAPGRSDYDEEFRKRLLSLFLQGGKVYLFDNIVGEFDSASLAAALTSETYEDRILQYSKTAKIHVKAMFLFTGNNLRFTGDMSRRVLTTRLKPADAKLAQRKYDFDPRDRATHMRKQIISSVLSLINHWKHCGAPRATGTMTSYSEWDTLVRQPLAHIANTVPKARLVDVLDVSIQQQNGSNDKDITIALLVALAAKIGITAKFKAGDVQDHYRINDRGLIADAILAFRSKDKLQSSSHFGYVLRDLVDKNVDGLVLRAKKASGSMTYWVELTDDTHRPLIEQLSTVCVKSVASNDFDLAA